MIKKGLLCIAGAALFSSCQLFEYHPYDVDVNYRNINAENIFRIERNCAGKDTIRFVWMGDSQRFYDETQAMVDNINLRNDVDFVMHGGDISDFGMNREFDWVHHIMSRLFVPYVALIGNHDILGNGCYVFEAMYGPLNYSFIAGPTKFVCLNTNALEFDYSRPVPDFEFIRQEFSDTLTRSYDQTIVAMHANPFGEQFNNNAAYVFQAYISRLKNLQLCLHAHAHSLMVNDYFEDGILYYGCDAMKKRTYMLFTVTKDQYEYEVIDF